MSVEVEEGRTRTLGEFALPRRERVSPSSEPDARYIGMEHVPAHSGKIIGSAPAGSMRSTGFRFRRGDLLYGRLAPEQNKVARPDFDGICSSEFIVLTPQGIASASYLSWALMSSEFVAFASRLARGDRARVHWNEIARYPVNAPSAVLQTMLAGQLDGMAERLDHAADEMAAALRRLSLYERAVLIAATSGQLVSAEADMAAATDSSYVSASDFHAALAAQLPPRRRVNRTQPPDGPLPSGWRWTPLVELGILDRGKSRHRPRNDSRLLGGPYPFIQTGDVKHSQGVIRRHSQTYSEFGLAQSRLWPAGTLCVTVAANIAETGILTYPACFPDSVVGFTQPEHPDLVHYVELCIRSMKQRLWQLAPATAQKNINLGTLSDLWLPLPPPAEQVRIVDEVDRHRSIVQELKRAILSTAQRSRRLRAAATTAVMRVGSGPPEVSQQW